MKDKYTELTNALIKAKEEAQKYINTEDGGTCNFDSPAIDYRAMHMSKAKAAEAIKAAGLRCFEWKSWGDMLLVICGIGAGQGNRNTRMAEAAYESLKNSGISATMFYQMECITRWIKGVLK
jgi:cell division GTPase FtsZ